MSGKILKFFSKCESICVLIKQRNETKTKTTKTPLVKNVHTVSSSRLVQGQAFNLSGRTGRNKTMFGNGETNELLSLLE